MGGAPITRTLIKHPVQNEVPIICHNRALQYQVMNLWLKKFENYWCCLTWNCKLPKSHIKSVTAEWYTYRKRKHKQQLNIVLVPTAFCWAILRLAWPPSRDWIFFCTTLYVKGSTSIGTPFFHFSPSFTESFLWEKSTNKTNYHCYVWTADIGHIHRT